jgi:hypothetical protein
MIYERLSEVLQKMVKMEHMSFDDDVMWLAAQMAYRRNTLKHRVIAASREGLNNPLDPRDFAAGRPKSRQSGRNSTFCRAARRVSPSSGRTYPAAGINRRRDIHRFDSANSVSTWAAFFAMPR